MKYKDYYKILGVERGAGDDQIKKAYRKLARKYHPDVSKEANAKEKFQEVSEAYETLEEAFRGTERTVQLDGRGFTARIPRGATDGQRLKLRGKGGPGMNGGPPGDLYLQIHLEPHPLFRVNGHDLDLEVPVTPWEAALGAQIEIPTMEGRVT